jgi:hypothetical protein
MTDIWEEDVVLGLCRAFELLESFLVQSLTKNVLERPCFFSNFDLLFPLAGVKWGRHEADPNTMQEATKRMAFGSTAEAGTA